MLTLEILWLGDDFRRFYRGWFTSRAFRPVSKVSSMQSEGGWSKCRRQIPLSSDALGAGRAKSRAMI